MTKSQADQVTHVAAAHEIASALRGVPETLLLPLWGRIAEQSRADRLIDDPLAVAAGEAIGIDLAARFGAPLVSFPLRARASDDLIAQYARDHGGGTVIALGEGLDTAFWRVGDARLSWYSVDVAPAIALRRAVLPADHMAVMIASSAFDTGWFDRIVSSGPPFITALGLFSYFEIHTVAELLTAMGTRFPGAQIVFDIVSPAHLRHAQGETVAKGFDGALPFRSGMAISQMRAFLERCGASPLAIRPYGSLFPARTPFTASMEANPFTADDHTSTFVHARLGA